MRSDTFFRVLAMIFGEFWGFKGPNGSKIRPNLAKIVKNDPKMVKLPKIRANTRKDVSDLI